MSIGRVRWAGTCLLVAVGFVVSPMRSWADSAPVSIPGPDEGYKITKTESSQEAPAGYEGRTSTVAQTAVGDTTYTTGKTVVTRFTLATQVKTCPNADGTTEGTGLFSMIIDSTNAQSDGTSSVHVDIRAKATYKGQVGDDGWIEGPVNAVIDYTYTVTGSSRGTGGALTSSPSATRAQQITIPIMISRAAMSPPDFGTVSGGDPTQGSYSEAYGTGIAVAYWGGVYYSIAETKWRQGLCVHLVFSPPSHTMQPVLGGDTTVNAELKTKGGENVAWNYQDLKTDVGSVTSDYTSSGGAPIKFIYTAPNKAALKGKTAGFKVSAMSHAGLAEAWWIAALGTDWSGQITCSHIYRGDQGHNDLQTWSNSESEQVSIDIGEGDDQRTATAYSEVKTLGIDKQKALRGGAIILIDDTSSETEGSFGGASKATLQIDINKSAGTYSISAGFASAMKPGKMHSVTCYKGNCHSTDQDYGGGGGGGCLPGAFGGKLSDLNHLQGTQNDEKTGLGRGRNGAMTNTLTWNLARTGTH